MASGTCVCGHAESLHGPSGCEVMLPDGRAGSRQCNCTGFYEKEQD
jgi:hypothetical protein